MKKILIALVALVVVAGIAIGAMVLFAPTEFGVEREVVINKSKSETFEYLRILRNQNAWGPWAKKDPNMKQEYRGEDGEVGFVSAWDSESDDVGAGEQEIKKIVDGERIDYELRFLKPFEATSDAWLITEDAGEGKTKVKWGFTGAMPRPFNVMMLFIDMEEAVGKDFEEGLASLKSELESQGS
ncbi:MAG: polyketide cyclase [Acidobacteria bacterium]|nr:MAG: polyketide cyclase [Acidobacteriota bacterium]REJ98159.1 MAG: polyketide cyclase [Acidobacteriota bacterium]REK16902.1 MAG: polyketide cyclase [Acidobacteriota bacterium]REK42813.1 MAG: polyketide cyclase [Acidobacteriota bacterium]